MNIMTNITYRQVNDYTIPNLRLPPEESAIRLGKWGMMYKDYLQKHNPVLFATFLIQGTLYQHCADIEKQAQQMFTTLVEQMKIAEGATEALKEENQMEWVRSMQNIESRAREIICHDIIFK